MPARPARWAINPAVVSTELGPQEVALVHLETKRIYGMNPCGVFVWRRLQKKHTPKEIALALAREFSISVSRAEKDVHSWLTQLRAKGILI